MDQVNLRMVAEIAFSDRTWNCLYFKFTVNIIIGKTNLDTLDLCVCVWSDLLFYFIPEILVFI